MEKQENGGEDGIVAKKHFAAFGYLPVNQWITSAKGLHKHFTSCSSFGLLCYLCWIFYHSYSPSRSFGNGAAKRANTPMSISQLQQTKDQLIRRETKRGKQSL
ncbi:uncharacterized protein LOC112187717 [Rosa chinensis]|uniref:uncharacterized protein LOC112187717 n=1 Tax=Rosa chinensis TaxID=74649 RepID=UPI001AD90A25|nr:uncharacterized protein LOC112187717 [Rosa chinensis]